MWFLFEGLADDDEARTAAGHRGDGHLGADGRATERTGAAAARRSGADVGEILRIEILGDEGSELARLRRLEQPLNRRRDLDEEVDRCFATFAIDRVRPILVVL